MTWWKRRSADDSAQKLWDEQVSWTKDMTARGWHHWMFTPPPSGEPLELSRQGWPAIQLVGSHAEVHAACNTNGLWWRPCRGPVIAGSIIEGTLLTTSI